MRRARILLPVESPLRDRRAVPLVRGITARLGRFAGVDEPSARRDHGKKAGTTTRVFETRIGPASPERATGSRRSDAR
jgi:hypothetical protein